LRLLSNAARDPDRHTTMIPQKPSLDPEQRRALRLLARSSHGYTESILLAHGFTDDMLGGLVLDGFATAAPETMRAGGRPIQVMRIPIIAECSSRSSTQAKRRSWRQLGSPR
jgi:hypothetical protein